MVQTRPGMPKPGTRTAVIAPDGDASFTQEMQARLADRLSAEYFEVQGSGHDVPLDATAPATVGLVLAWLRRSGQTTDPHLTTANR
jgi:hypothetical protein